MSRTQVLVSVEQQHRDMDARMAAAANLRKAREALNYVADMTYCGADAEWHFKPGYDPQHVLDALETAPSGSGLSNRS